MLLTYRYSVSLPLVGYMTTEAKCVQHVFKVCRLTIFMKMSECVAPYKHLETGYNGKQLLSKDELYLYFVKIHTEMP